MLLASPENNSLQRQLSVVASTRELNLTSLFEVQYCYLQSVQSN